MRFTRVFLPIFVLVAVLSMAASVYGLPSLQIPPVPHPMYGWEDCLACHDAGQIAAFPEDHAGRANDSCTMCHQVGEVESLPPIPHSLEGRENCLMCHDTGQVKPFPPDHEGRDPGACLLCHEAGEAEAEPEPEPTPEPTATLPPSVEAVPTPIHEPVLFEENTCISCHRELGGKHAEITDDWSESVHAAQGVGCVSCHGGDPGSDSWDPAVA